MGEVAKDIRAHGKKVIGWDEILDGTPMEEAVVMSWRGVEGGRRAARMGHDAIMTPLSHLYFDMSQILNRDAEEIPIGGYLNLEKVYTYEPVPADWSVQEKQHIIGVQANVWCEYMPEERIRQYLVLPRLAALSEIQWTAAAQKSYTDFLNRLPRLLQLYDAAGYHYASHCRKVNMDSYVDTVRRCAVFKFYTLGNDSIFYTLDGTSPVEQGIYFAADSLTVHDSAQLRAAVKREGYFEEEELLSALDVNKATFAPIRFLTKDGLSPYGSDPRLLVDGVQVGVVFFIVFQIFPHQLVVVFGDGSTEYFQFAERYFRIFMFMTFINGIQPMSSGFFTSIGKARLGIVVSLTRQVLFLLPLILIFPLFMGIDGVMYAGPIADAAAAVVAIFYALRELNIMKNLEKKAV